MDNFKREEYLSWDDYFMSVSLLASLRSKDPSTQVGACIVSSDNRILSTGYNGAPTGYSDDEFPWGRESESALDNKYLFVVHAERNAVLNYRGSMKDFVGAKIYVNLFPCNECAKELVQTGIKEVVYVSDKYSDTDEVKASKMIFDKCGVIYRKHESINVDLITEKIEEIYGNEKSR
ncbi:MAG: dCMP deaminase family protein [bacterium]